MFQKIKDFLNKSLFTLWGFVATIGRVLLVILLVIFGYLFWKRSKKSK